ncbi:hypothetical protein BKA63DRAFT_573283 [Paraphoma chrysanthemicola]|nr:hypothetical protein BKA63DRAFT_573283 [Paraphoma chrysanthemicola]
MASNNHHAFTAQPPSASALGLGLFEYEGNMNFDATNDFQPQPPAKNVPSNEMQMMLTALELVTDLLNTIKNAQESRLSDDKLQDAALSKSNKNLGYLHKLIIELRSEFALLAKVVENLTVKVDKQIKQAEDTRTKHIVQEVVSQALPAIVHQIINRNSHHHPPQS